MATSLARRQLSVAANPFSTATLEPKLPDGKTNTSAGWRLQNTFDFTVGGEVTNLLLFPGLKSCVVIDGKEQITPAVTDAAGNITTPESRATVSFRNNLGSDHVDIEGPAGTGLDAGEFSLNDATPLSRWRCVSVGMKLTLVNNSEDDDGWFEATRFMPQTEGTEVLVDTEAGVYPKPSSLFGARGYNMIQNQSYITGKLRNLHKHIFYCQTNNNSHDFVDIPNAWKYDASIAGQNTWDIVNDFIDKNMDMIHIRIHGRQGPAPGAANANPCCKGTKLMCHTISNIETVYNLGALSRHHTKGESYPSGIMRMYRKQQMNVSPSMTSTQLTRTLPTYSLRPLRKKRYRTKSSSRKYKKR